MKHNLVLIAVIAMSLGLVGSATAQDNPFSDLVVGNAAEEFEITIEFVDKLSVQSAVGILRKFGLAEVQLLFEINEGNDLHVGGFSVGLAQPNDVVTDGLESNIREYLSVVTENNTVNLETTEYGFANTRTETIDVLRGELVERVVVTGAMLTVSRSQHDAITLAEGVQIVPEPTPLELNDTLGFRSYAPDSVVDVWWPNYQYAEVGPLANNYGYILQRMMWESARIRSFASNDGYEPDAVFGHNFYFAGSGVVYWASNLPGAYLDTRALDSQLIYTIGTHAPDTMFAWTTYYTYIKTARGVFNSEDGVVIRGQRNDIPWWCPNNPLCIGVVTSLTENRHMFSFRVPGSRASWQ